MGCDIHLFTEVKKNGKWESADRWVRDEDDDGRMRVPYGKRFYDGRAYNLFAILANVRNGRGFAGIKTGEGFNPISEPKGLPEDVCDLVKAESDGWGCDGHSHSWHTLADLLAYDWTQTTKLQGVLSAAEFWRWNNYRRGQGLGPESYCGDVAGSMVVILDESVLSKRLGEIVEMHKGKKYSEIETAICNSLPHTYCRVSWEHPYYRSSVEFWCETVPRLLRLGKPEDVRIVFWFDN